MKQVWINHIGSPEVLQVKEAPDPQPQAGEMLVEVKASGLNFADIMARQGLYPDAPKPPAVMGYEVAGLVEAVGSGVDSGWVGKPVIATTRFGGHSSKVTVPVGQAFPKPESLSFEQAAALPVSYLTAYQLIVVMGALRPGETMLVHNAGSALGLAALDFSRHIGAVPYGTASAAKHDFLRQRGYERLFDYRSGDWEPEVKTATAGKGVDLILDSIGGKNWKKSYRALGPAGRLDQTPCGPCFFFRRSGGSPSLH
jgi:NADPH:quinone reductase-like Zn-dependent oxidoreductase